MLFEFDKLSANGNDFILFDNREGVFSGSEHTLFRTLCARRTGIGADGILLIEADDRSDFRLRYFNADGFEANMCGNGARASAWWAWQKGLSRQVADFFVHDERYRAFCRDDRVSLLMHAPDGLKELPEPAAGQGMETGFFLMVGVPHYVVFGENLSAQTVATAGAAICAHPLFARGTNVNFVEYRQGGSDAAVRTWERGVNAETLSCGTGALASAWVLHRKFRVPFPIILQTKGGTLTVALDEETGRPLLSGEVRHIFHGQLTSAALRTFNHEHQVA